LRRELALKRFHLISTLIPGVGIALRMVVPYGWHYLGVENHLETLPVFRRLSCMKTLELDLQENAADSLDEIVPMFGEIRLAA